MACLLTVLPLLLLPLSFTHALDGIVVPSTITADEAFQVTFENGNSDVTDQYRVFVSAASVGQNGPMCMSEAARDLLQSAHVFSGYLQNLTSLISPFTGSIPAAIGPDGSDYSIGIADITTNQGATFSNKFNFTGGNSTPSAYESELNGAPFWNAYELPCTAMPCVRQCAQTSFPGDLTDDGAYQTMEDCIQRCPGIGANATTNQPVNSGQANTIPVAVVTIAPSLILTAYETTVTDDRSSVITEAIIGNQTLTFGESAQTVVSTPVSLASSALIIGGTSTIPFSVTAASTRATTSMTATASPSPTATYPGSASKSKACWTAVCFAAIVVTCFLLVSYL